MKNTLTPIKEESLTDSKKTPSVASNVLVLEPNYCPCAKFFLNQPKGKDPCDDKSYSSILDRAFTFRRDASLDMAVQLQEKNIMTLYSSLEQMEEEQPTAISEITIESITSTATKTTSTPCVPTDETTVSDQDRIKYLKELEHMEPVEEQSFKSLKLEKKAKDVCDMGDQTEAMKLAQKYLRIHKIFEFFQFLIAHLLGHLPENPIKFLLDLLDKCIVYRAGMAQPPLLYEKKHIGALFDLMDPMKTQYIDLKQYVTGMKTLGICSFKRNPPVTKENTVFRQIFIDEAYEKLIELLDDILKRRWINYKAGTSITPLATPPPTLTHLAPISDTKKAAAKVNAVEDIYLSCGKEVKII